MESVTMLRPLAPDYLVFCFLSEPNIPKGPEYEKYQHYIVARGEFVPTPGFFQQHHQSVKRFGCRSEQTHCRPWSDSKLFAMVISRR